MKSRLRLLTLLTLSAALGFGQNSVSFSSSSTGYTGMARFGPPPRFGMPAVTGAPYSGEQVGETVQTLADGTHITRTMPVEKVYRDSQGRTRTERPMHMRPVGSGSNVPDSPVIIEINDPVARARYILDTENRVAHRQELPPPPERQGGAGYGTSRVGMISAGGGGGTIGAMIGQVPMSSPGARVVAPASEAGRPQMTMEKLGTQTIEGVLVEGTRHTSTWPVGSEGNDRPITSISETWISPELKVVILSKSSDPRSGEYTHKLINISRSEPDPSLFQPPPGYTVVEDKDEVTIKWGSRQ